LLGGIEGQRDVIELDDASRANAHGAVTINLDVRMRMVSNHSHEVAITLLMTPGIVMGLLVGFVCTAIFGPAPRRRKEASA
jgi:hypothetical protein